MTAPTLTIRPTYNFAEGIWVIARRHWALLVAFWLPMGIYLSTMAQTFFGLDSAEFSTAAYRLGVPHATGYPLYLMLGKLFTYLPVGDIGYRVSLMTGIFSALTVTVLYLLILHLTRRVVLSLAMALFLGFSYYFWTQSVAAEVYTLHTFLTGLVFLFCSNGIAPEIADFCMLRQGYGG